MMKAKFFILGAVAFGLTAAGVAFATVNAPTEITAPQRAVDKHSIPGSLPVAEWTYSGTGGIRFENDDKGVGYIKSNSIASIDFRCNKAGVYNMAWKVNKHGDGNVNIEIKDLTTGNVEINQNWTVEGGEFIIPLQGVITEGNKRITFTITASHGGYIANYFSPTFEWVSDEITEAPAGWDVIPGQLPVRNWVYTGSLRIENAGNVGYVQAGDRADHFFYCNEPGVYRMDMNIPWFQNVSDLEITITDRTSHKTQVDTKYTVTGTQDAQILLPGLITKGAKDIRFQITSSKGGFMFNWNTPNFVKVGDSFAAVFDVTTDAAGVEATTVDGFDYAFIVPTDFSGSAITLTADYDGGELTATCEQAEVTALGEGKYSVPVPAPNGETIVNLSLTPAEGAYSGQTDYKVRIYRIGGVELTALTVDGFTIDTDRVAAINAGDSDVTIDDYIFSALPAVKATFIDGSTADATATLSGNTATYTVTGVSGEKQKTFSFKVDGIHVYNRTPDDKDAKLTYDGNYKQDDGSWSNGLFTINPCGDGWGGTQFKLGRNPTITLTAPNDMKVNVLILGALGDNYQSGRVVSVTSEGAQVWLPSASSFEKDDKKNLVIPVDNHVAGTPFVITMQSDGQPYTWFEFIYQTVVPSDAPEVVATSTTPLEGKNHTVVSFTMNRQILDTKVEFNGTTVAGTASGVTLSFPLWDLEYDTDYVFTLPAGTVTDTYGNSNTEPLSCAFHTGIKHEDVVAVETERFFIVSNITELRAAVASLYQTNTTAASPMSVIYILNGDYDLGSDLDENGDSPTVSDVCLGINKLYNISLIGESQEGVLIHGTRTGISNPIFSTRNSTNIYMENFTLRNDLDFGKARKGVGVAHYGGNLDIMKNITLQSQQDTQVTGARGYYLNCTFHGTVDYVCGDGDHFYDHCTFVQESTGPLTAPMTSESLRHGYVFRDCTIKGAAGYTLGRPWQHEPRCYWINTTMLSLPADNGWGGMGTLPTHFYEYNSMDANGNPLDLSKRKNSDTSTNKYTPILTADEAAYFTVRNVLGYTDSWDPENLTAECDAPIVTISQNTLKWEAIPGAAGYLIHTDGVVTDYTAETTYTLPAAASAVRKAEVKSAPVYTVAAVSPNGAKGTVSAPASDETTGLSAISAESYPAAVEYFNLQGIRMDASAKGILIRVTVNPDGSRTAEKITRN